jgi:uncharacterized protein (DUF2147 family)
MASKTPRLHPAPKNQKFFGSFFQKRTSLLLLFVLAIPQAQATPAKPPTGLWFTEDHGGVVQISTCGEKLCGTIVGLTPNPQGVMPRDVHGDPQCHLPLLRDLRLHEDDGRWHGTVTNPEDGKVYDAEVWVPSDGKMRLRGYVGVPLLGSTQTWPPFNGKLQADCRFH